MSDDQGRAARPAPDSAGEAAKAVTEDVRRLVRAEVELAKAEVMGQVAAKGVAIGLLAFAGLLSLYIVGWLSYALFRLFVPELRFGVAALLTAAILLAVAGLLAAIGGLILRRPMQGPERAQAAAEQAQAMVKDKLGRRTA